VGSHKELVDLIRDQIEIERESVERLAETQQKVGTGAAKLLLIEMRCDSQKHAAVLEAVLEALSGDQSSKPLWQRAFSGFADPIIVKREIENHKTLGKSMVAHIQEEMSKTSDEAVRTLLQHLTEDEKRHGEILDTIAQRCYSIIR
jgi:rubrerythrin